MTDLLIEELETSNGDTLERLRNITKMFSSKTEEEDEQQTLQKIEKFSPSEKIKRTFQKFEEIGSSNGQYDDENEDTELLSSSNSDEIIRSTRKKRTTKEHIPYHEMAEVKDKFEKGLIDQNRPRTEKRLDVRVQSGLASSKKQAFEQGEFERDSSTNKVPIDAEVLLTGLTLSKKQAFQQSQQESTKTKTNIIEHDLLAGAAREKRAKFERGEFDQEQEENRSHPDEIANILGTGLAQAKLSELLSKIDAEQQFSRSSNRPIDLDTEQGLATARRDQLASLANCEFKAKEKHIDVAAGLTSSIRDQYMADTSKSLATSTEKPIDIETGLARSRANVFENPDESAVKRTIELENELSERGMAKERVAMFKNLESGAQISSTMNHSGDAKLRFDENGNIVRESDKRAEIYFEKGQTKQLVEQWKSKQISPERDLTTSRDTSILQQGQAKNLVEMWKTLDQENTPPSERRKPRPMTPPADSERYSSASIDEESFSQRSTFADDTTSIESGHAKAIRERLMQSAEQNNGLNLKKTVRQITPPPLSSDMIRRKLSNAVEESNGYSDTSINSEDIVLMKGQAKSLKNRFVELEQDARKVETAASKIKYVPKRFVDKPAPKQIKTPPTTNPSASLVDNEE